MRTSLLFAIVMAAAVATAADDSPHAKSAGAGIRGAGFTYAKEVYPRFMKDPSSASFDWESVTSDHKFDVRDRETQTMYSVYVVNGIVRSKNSFNAIVPTEWSVFVVEGESGTEMAVAMLNGKIVAKSQVGERLITTIEKIAADKEKRAREETLRRGAEAERAREEKEARDDGGQAGVAHGAKLGKKTKALSSSDITRRAKKLAADAGYEDDRLIELFVQGYADAMAEAAK